MTAMEDARSIPELLGDAVSQASKLFSAEVELARAEASRAMSEFAHGALMIAIGLALAMPALVLLLMSIAAALVGAGLSPAIADLLVAVPVLALAAAGIATGLSRLSADRLLPRATLEQMRRDRTAARELMPRN